MSNSKIFNSNFIQIKNIFSYEICNKIYLLFKKEKNWKLQKQIKSKHYSHVFKSKLSAKLMPNEKEIYYARFYRSDNLRNNEFINSNLKKFIFPILKKKKIYFKNFDIRCHKFIKGNFLRSHYDDYAGTHAVTINFNKVWRADWGGILGVLAGKNYEDIHFCLPQWNTMNILSPTKKNKCPHFVSSVEFYANEPRYSLTIFLS